MALNHAPAVIRWRDHLDTQPGGLAAFEQSYTVSTMLFGCRRWIETNEAQASPEEAERIRSIMAELEAWMAMRGVTYR